MKRTALRLLLSVALLLAVFAWVGGGVLDVLRTVRLAPYCAVLAGFLLLHLLSALKWRYFAALSGAELPLGPALRCYSAGLFANLCLPSLVGGDLVRAGLASRFARMEAVLLSTALERLTDVAALLLLTTAGMVAAPHAASPLVLVPLALLLALALGGAILLFRIPIRRWPRRLARFLLRGLRAFRTMKSSPGRLLLGAAICVALQSGFVLLNVALAQSIAMHLDLRLWFLLWPLSKLASMLPLSLGGLGVREASFGLLVAPFLDSRLAVAESLLWQSILVAGGLLAGVYWIASQVRRTRSA